MAKAKQITITVPLGTAVYPSLHKLDTEGRFPTGKFKTSIQMDPVSLAKFKADFAEKTKGMKGAKGKLPFKKDKEGNELVTMKSKFMPLGFDSKNNRLPEGTDVGGGSLIRCQCGIYDYEDGISLQILQYQVKELKVWSRESAFEPDDDGYTFESEEKTEDFAGDTDGDLDI